MFGQELSNLRRKRRVPQKALARALELDQSYFSRIESGKKPPPHGDHFVQNVTAALDLTAAEVARLMECARADRALGGFATGATVEQAGLALTLLRKIKTLHPAQIRAIDAILCFPEEASLKESSMT